MSIRVALVDDEPLVRAGLVAIVDSDPELDVIGEAEDGAEAIDLAARTCLDVVIMDVHMPRLDGLEATRLMMAKQEPPRDLRQRRLRLRSSALRSRRLRSQTCPAGGTDPSRAYGGRRRNTALSAEGPRHGGSGRTA